MATKKPNDGIYLMGRPLAHDHEVPHAYGHTKGRCPKCGQVAAYVLFCLPGQSVLPRVSGCEVDGDHIHRQCACGYGWVERCFDQFMLSQEEGYDLAESELMAALACIVHRSNGALLDQAVVAGYRGWTIRFKRDPELRSFTITAEETPATGKPAFPELRHPGSPGTAPAA
ncbi:MAG TPA: hypothetical protein VJX71_09820 [Methylomirabilota bacterium]|nr:hypothetical protein [Methylomirabilota bacterium]